MKKEFSVIGTKQYDTLIPSVVNLYRFNFLTDVLLIIIAGTQEGEEWRFEV